MTESGAKQLWSDNECYGLPRIGGVVGLTRWGARPANSVGRPQFTSECVICSTPLKGRQRRCCSLRCVRRLAAEATSQRDQSGEKNPNFRGWRSRNPILYTKPYKQANPDKVLAQNKLGRAVRSGKVVRPEFCDSCFRECRPDAHHDDYSRPLSVQWLCRKCHIAHHRTLSRQHSADLVVSGSPTSVERRGREC